MADENLPFDFSSRTYSTIRQDLLRRASAFVPEWTDRDPSDFGMVFVDLWSYMGDIMHYYIDRAAQEAFITTATQRESLIAYANLYDYKPNGRESSTATVYVSNSSSSSSGTVILPAYSQLAAVVDDKRYYFHTVEAITLEYGTTTSVEVIEGNYVSSETLTTYSSGLPSQSYTLANTNAAVSTIKVYVTDEGSPIQWTRYENVSDIPSGAKGYVVYLTSSGELQILFGNRINGFIPPAGSTITASYTKSSGSLGNIGSNLIKHFVSVQPNQIAITSSTSATGGTNGETAESLKTNIISSIRTQDRAVTLQDYADAVRRVAGVEKSVAVYTPSSAGASASASVSLYALPYISDYLTPSASTLTISSSLASSVLSNVSEKSMIGIYLHVPTSITTYRLNITAEVFVNQAYVAEWVKNDVSNAIDGLLSFTNADFGKEIPIGKVYKTIMDVEGVDYVKVSTYSITQYNGSSWVTMKDYITGTGTDLPYTGMLQKGIVVLTTTNGMTTSA